MKEERLLLAWVDDMPLALVGRTVRARIEIERVTTRRLFRRPVVAFVANVLLPVGMAPRVLIFACPTIPRAAEIAADMLNGMEPR
jgi:hypothetical protein